MTARRTRSLSELPGHVRVPILRRKDTQRTKDRLAAGLAGMEELRSLREQQQQLVGETVAKSEDKRQERRLGTDSRGFLEDDEEGEGDAYLVCTTTSSPLSPAQALLSPRRPVPHPRSSSFYRGQSMDSISEEGDGLTNNNNNNGQQSYKRQQTVDNNNNNTNDRTTNSVAYYNNNNINESSRDQVFQEDLESSLTLCINPSSSLAASQKHGYPVFGNETIINSQHNLQTLQTQQNHFIPHDTSPRSCNGNTQKQRQGFGEDGNGLMDGSIPTPTRRRSLSSQPHSERPVPSPRQRSMSLDLGQPGIQPSPSPLLRQPTLSKNGHIHNRFSSLTSINQTDNNDRLDASRRRNSISADENETSRLSQSMTQINNIGNSSRQTPLKRRGSLTWDSLLKSIGIQNPGSSDSDSLQTQDNKSETDDDQKSDPGKENDDSSQSESRSSRIDENILLNRKKGRSMSFTCSNHAPLFNPTTNFNHRMNLTRQNAVVADHDLGAKMINNYNYNNSNKTSPNSSIETSPLPSKSIHPMLRRASIQCEAVLTNSSRVVNPIQDVDVTSCDSPGPLHAVMLQYRGFNSSAGVRTTPDQVITKPNKPLTQEAGTQELSNTCLSARTNTAKRPLSESTKNSSDLTSHPRTRDRGAISPGLVAPDKQDRKGCNITREDKNSVSDKTGDNNKFSKTEKCLNKGGGVIRDANKVLNGNVDVSIPHVTPDLARESENAAPKTCVRSTEGESLNPQTSLRHNLSDVRECDSHGSRIKISARDIDSTNSGDMLKCENGEQHDKSDVVSFNKPKLSNSNCNNLMVGNSGSGTSKNGLHLQSTTVLDSINKCVQNNSKQDSNLYIGSSDQDANLPRNECYKTNNHQVHPTRLPVNRQRHEFRQESRHYTTGNNGLYSPATAPSSNATEHDESLFRSVSQSQFGHHNIIEEVDIIRNKRSSIFSDVSVMSDVSSKTPSSSASVFSDVSMVSDEGYQTCESASPENKLSHLKRLSSVSSSYVTTTHAHNPVTSSREGMFSNSTQKHETRFVTRDKNGNDVLSVNGMPSGEFEKHDNGEFRYGKEKAFDSRASVVQANPLSRQGYNSNGNQPVKLYRKPSKQTTV